MLLSELASTDLTDALLQDRKPSFPPTIWEHMEPGSVWWESVPGTKSLGSVLSTLSEMSLYRHELQKGVQVFVDKAQAFERVLQPTYSMLSSSNGDAEQDLFHPVATATLSLFFIQLDDGLAWSYRMGDQNSNKVASWATTNSEGLRLEDTHFRSEQQSI
ncbi:hypothetical protein G6011_10941 [Alternaria panax]|uniref:Uncharacterized protein n=1 Tax=Alternaria panax TaxID=48097 RepID=A0AAD4ICJ1_9PLEO|nr:hypothetical protein G6011_10941 [Alternaria panax]